jgi:hypothetical protein
MLHSVLLRHVQVARSPLSSNLLKAHTMHVKYMVD